MTAQDAILRLLIDRAPNWVNEGMLRERLSGHGEAAVTAGIRALVDANRIIEEIDQRAGFDRAVRYYRLSQLEGVPIRDAIKVGDVEVPRLLSESNPKYFPEDFNETIERLAEYTAGLQRRFAELVKQEQRRYWANIVSIFSVFVAVLALIIVGLPQIRTDPSLSFCRIVALNSAQLLPLAVVLAIFVLVLRWVIR